MDLFKKKEKKEPLQTIFKDSIIYFEYNMKIIEKIVLFIIGFGIGVAVGYIFYSIIPVAIIFGLIVGVAIIPIRKKQCKDKKILTLKAQFKDLLESLSTSIGAGRNINDSFLSAHNDLADRYSKDAYIVKEIENIISGINNNINIETLLLDLANRSGIDDIKTFAEVFETCYRRGGDIKEVVLNCYNVINQKIEIEMEIKTMVTSANTELTMMCCMPVIFVLLLNSMGSNITGQGTIMGYLSTTIALALFVVSFVVGKKIMKIKV